MAIIKRLPQLDGQLGWYETAAGHERPLGKKIQKDEIFDVVIVGAGFTGLAFAHRLAEREKDCKIAIVDALKIGQGTSGRNAGFIIDVPHNVDGSEPDVANDLKLYKLNLFAIERLRQWKDSFGISCDWQEAGKYMAAHENRNLTGLDQFVRQLQACGFAFEDLDAQETNKRLGTDYYQRSIYTPGNILMNPAALVRGIAGGLPANISLLEQCAVTKIDYGQTHHIHTGLGNIKAKNIVLATNVFNEEFGKLKYRLAPVFTYASLTQPLSQDEAAVYFKGIKPWGLTSAHGAGTTVRYTTDKRIFIRNVLQFSSTLVASQLHLDKAKMQHRKSFEKRFSKLRHIPFEYSWGGMIAVTLNHDSVFSKPDDNVMVLNGCNGVGVGKGTYLGTYAADYLLGDQNETLDFILNHSHPSFIPPDPLRRIGAQVRLYREQKKAGGDI